MSTLDRALRSVYRSIFGPTPPPPELLELRERVAELTRERDGVQSAYEQAAAELAAARTDAGGYKAAYEQAAASLGKARTDAAGYKAAYEHTLARSAAEIDTARAEAAGCRNALSETNTELSRFRTLLRSAKPPADRPRPFVFLHVEKTGGITLAQFFGKQFSWERALSAYSPEELDAYPPEELAHFEYIGGHITARNLAAIRPDAVVCTFLREPTDRVVSAYWYFRTYAGRVRESIRHAVEAARSQSLLDFLRNDTPEVRRHVANQQAWSLAADWFAPDDRSPGALLSAALEGLARCACVGLTEELDAGLGEVCRVMGWTPPAGRLARTNVTPSRQRIDELTADELAAIEEITAVDAEVYRAASRGRSV
jgi:hypothetical protein